MQGLLADINLQGLLPALCQLLRSLDLWPILAELNVSFATFPEVGILTDLNDRAIWNRCQADGCVLWTENRNLDEEDSLQATLADSWRIGHLPVLTLARKPKFETNRDYAETVAADIAELLFGICAANTVIGVESTFPARRTGRFNRELSPRTD